MGMATLLSAAIFMYLPASWYIPVLCDMLGFWGVLQPWGMVALGGMTKIWGRPLG